MLTHRPTVGTHTFGWATRVNIMKVPNCVGVPSISDSYAYKTGEKMAKCVHAHVGTCMGGWRMGSEYILIAGVGRKCGKKYAAQKKKLTNS